MKICKFLRGPSEDEVREEDSEDEEEKAQGVFKEDKELKDDGHNCLVSADMDGYLNFYAIFPSPFKNQLLTRKIFYNEKE